MSFKEKVCIVWLTDWGNVLRRWYSKGKKALWQKAVHRKRHGICKELGEMYWFYRSLERSIICSGELAIMCSDHADNGVDSWSLENSTGYCWLQNRTTLLRHGMYGSMTIVIVLQGQLDYCSRAKDKTHGVFCLRHYRKEHWRLQVLSWGFKLSCAVESGSGSMICDLQWWSKSFLITGQEVYRLFQSMPLTCCVLRCFNRDRLSETPWTVACQAPLSMGFSRQEYWSGLPHPPLVDICDLGVESASLLSPDLAGGFFTTNATWEVL